MSSFELDEESNDDLEANISFNIIRKEFFDNNEISELYGKELINFKPDNIIEWRKEMEEKDKVKIVPKMNLGLLFKINPDSDEDSSSSEFMFPYQDNLSDDEIDFDFDSDISYTFNCKREQALKISFQKKVLKESTQKYILLKRFKNSAPYLMVKDMKFSLNYLKKVQKH